MKQDKWNMLMQAYVIQPILKPRIGNETSTEQGHYSRRGLQTGIKGEDAGGEPTMPEGLQHWSTNGKGDTRSAGSGSRKGKSTITNLGLQGPDDEVAKDVEDICLTTSVWTS